MISDYFIQALKGIRRRKVRSGLTIIGILIGITAIVSLISLGQGLQDAVNEQFQKVGINRVIVTPGGLPLGPAGGDLTTAMLTEDDMEVVEKVKGVDNALGVLLKTKKVEFRDQVEYLSVAGFPTDPDSVRIIEDVGLYDIEFGRQLRASDNLKAVLGRTIADEGFDKEITTRDSIEIEGIKFSIVGVQEKIGTGIHDIMIRIPMDTARNLFDEPDEVSMIIVTTKKDEEPGVVAERIKKALRKYRDVEQGHEDFSAETAEQSIKTLTNILGIVQIFLVGIAAISLFVGGVGIMNTMYTSVLERRKEIGIMKAVGARNIDVLFIFLTESGILGLVGGILGVGLGLGFAKIGEFIAVYLGVTIFQAHISVGLITGALLFSFFIGSISGLLPARQASGLTPVEALRSI